VAKLDERTSWFDAIWPLAIAATGVGYGAIAYGVARWLTRPSPAHVEIPAIPGCTVTALQCRTSDGIALKGSFIEPRGAHATVALFHGMRTHRGDMLERMLILTAAGYRCVAFDHRGHGESVGPWTSFGYHERHDVEAVADLIQSRWPNQPSAALGFSMGAAAIAFAAQKADRFDAIVLESLYHDLARAFQQRVGGDFPHWFGYFRRGIVWCIESRLGLCVDDVAPVAQISKLTRPLLFLTGSDDPHAPPEDIERLARQAKGRASVAIIAGADHDQLVVRGGALYQQLLLAFLDEHLARHSLSRAA
jgi:uncharacterized protein